MSNQNNNDNPGIISFYYRHKEGGFTTRLYRSWLALANAGYEVTYIASEVLPVSHDKITPLLLNMRSKDGTALYWMEFYLKAVLAARRLATLQNTQCYFVFSFFYGALALLSAAGSGIKTLVFIRADDLHDARLKSFAGLRIFAHMLLEKISMRFAAKVITNNKNMVQTLSGRNRRQPALVSLPNNIPPAMKPFEGEKRSASDGIIRLVTVAVLNPRKNHLLVLQALKQLKQKNWKYLIIGEDVEQTGYGRILRDYTREHRLESQVEFVGWLDNASDIVGSCDLFLLPTTMEGSPNALLEALGTHIACMGSNIPEVSEILGHQELTFDTNDPDSLAQKLATFLTDPKYREKIQRLSRACKSSYQFDWNQRIVDCVDELKAPAPDQKLHSALQDTVNQES